MEITDRTDLGADLHAPQLDGGGREYWSYSLVEWVREGDVVLHWWKRPGGEPALVGWSRAVGVLEEDTIDWLAHGTRGRARGDSVEQSSWRQPLEDFTELPAPVSLAALRRIESRLHREHVRLADRVGQPLYFPFAFSDRRPLRTTQGYLVKFPAGLVPMIPGLEATLDPTERPGDAQGTGPQRGRTGDRRMDDPALRSAVERHSVGRVIAYLQAEGYECADVGTTRSYDIEATKNGDMLHVEVKGSISRCLTVELTSGEVDHAGGEVSTLLAVVDGIGWHRESGRIETSGGDLRLWWDWEPESEALVPIRFRYLLPE
jgi:hypothetical protein